MFAAFDVEQSLVDFVKSVDMPKVHPAETIDEVMSCLGGNGIHESWHMVGLTVNAFKKESFKDAFIIGAVVPAFLCAHACIELLPSGFVTRLIKKVNTMQAPVAQAPQPVTVVGANAEMVEQNNRRACCCVLIGTVDACVWQGACSTS